jgi:ribosomal protein L11 methylase PrmA
VGTLLVADSPLRIPLGLAVLPLSSWWIKLFSGGAPFVTTNHAKTRAIVRLVMGGAAAGQKDAKKLVGADLGSGDGRLAIALARAGASEVHGYEINWLLVQYSRARVARAGLSDRITIHWQSMWDVDLSHCDVVTTYQHTMVMAKLEAKLLTELKPTARVVSNSFRFPNWCEAKRAYERRECSHAHARAYF